MALHCYFPNTTTWLFPNNSFKHIHAGTRILRFMELGNLHNLATFAISSTKAINTFKLGNFSSFFF